MLLLHLPFAIGWLPIARSGSVETIGLTDPARLRLQTLSFFLAGFLLSALLIQWVWSGLRRQVPALPQLSYLRAAGLAGLWGLLFVLVLTMLEGARELMTTGAPEPPDLRAATDEAQAERRQQLLRLKTALWQYARGHGGRFPPDRSDPGVLPERWLLPDASGLRYLYAGAAGRFDVAPLAFEPEVYQDGRWVLFPDGEVRLLKSEELGKLLPAEKK